MTLTLAKLVKALFSRNQKLIKSLTAAYDSSESDDDFDKAFQSLIIASNMFLGDSW